MTFRIKEKLECFLAGFVASHRNAALRRAAKEGNVEDYHLALLKGADPKHDDWNHIVERFFFCRQDTEYVPPPEPNPSRSTYILVETSNGGISVRERRDPDYEPIVGLGLLETSRRSVGIFSAALDHASPQDQSKLVNLLIDTAAGKTEKERDIDGAILSDTWLRLSHMVGPYIQPKNSAHFIDTLINLDSRGIIRLAYIWKRNLEHFSLYEPLPGFSKDRAAQQPVVDALCRFATVIHDTQKGISIRAGTPLALLRPYFKRDAEGWSITTPEYVDRFPEQYGQPRFISTDRDPESLVGAIKKLGTEHLELPEIEDLILKIKQRGPGNLFGLHEVIAAAASKKAPPTKGFREANPSLQPDTVLNGTQPRTGSNPAPKFGR